MARLGAARGVGAAHQIQPDSLYTDEGKLDFQACRVVYVSWVVEAGASVKEAQALARHATPDLTVNGYARARTERLAEVAERLGENFRSIAVSHRAGRPTRVA